MGAETTLIPDWNEPPWYDDDLQLAYYMTISQLANAADQLGLQHAVTIPRRTDQSHARPAALLRLIDNPDEYFGLI